MKKPVNVNDECLVTLTDAGLRVYQKHCHHPTGERWPNYPKEAKEYKFQLWELMRIFGEMSYNGAEQLFVNNEIRFVK